MSIRGIEDIALSHIRNNVLPGMGWAIDGNDYGLLVDLARNEWKRAVVAATPGGSELQDEVQAELDIHRYVPDAYCIYGFENRRLLVWIEVADTNPLSRDKLFGLSELWFFFDCIGTWSLAVLSFDRFGTTPTLVPMRTIFYAQDGVAKP